ncbi:MAG: RluA family pseudouridine synthase [Bacteroidota bacterium]|nr:RluA family pseudouridine synthase [Bacteroidota bacterium]
MSHTDNLKSNDILFEDNHLLLINKKPGILTQGDKTGDKSLIDLAKYYIKKKYNKPGNVFIGLPHRIDRPTSGIVILSKTSKSLSRISKLFKEKKIEKKYWAIVKNKIENREGKLIHFLKKNQKKNKSFVQKEKKDDHLKAELEYKLIKKMENYFLYEIKLITGRHHQIRAQLSYIGSPIKGDIKYGFKRTNKDGSISLHSREINFIHPVKKNKIQIIAPTPDDDLWKYC